MHFYMHVHPFNYEQLQFGRNKCWVWLLESVKEKKNIKDNV